jgi:hypothetical protein
MQTGIKQSGAEIDGMFLGKTDNGDIVIITMEAKGKKDDILETQVLRQISAALSMKSIKKNIHLIAPGTKRVHVLPMAMKITSDLDIYVAEYESVPFGGTTPEQLVLESEGLYEITPAIPGVNK